MSQFSEDLKVIFDELKKQREVLALQIHLASAEVKDEWDELEKKWESFSLKAKQVIDELKESSKDVEDDLTLLGDDLKEHYSHIKNIVD